MRKNPPLPPPSIAFITCAKLRAFITCAGNGASDSGLSHYTPPPPILVIIITRGYNFMGGILGKTLRF